MRSKILGLTNHDKNIKMSIPTPWRRPTNSRGTAYILRARRELFSRICSTLGPVNTDGDQSKQFS